MKYLADRRWLQGVTVKMIDRLRLVGVAIWVAHWEPFILSKKQLINSA